MGTRSESRLDPAAGADALAPERPWTAALGGVAAAAFALFYVPTFLGLGYGYFIDELYYIACARRLAWGFVDHPPLSPALLSPVLATLGDSLAAVRLLPALIGAATVALTGVVAARLGAGRYGQLLAAGAVLAVPVFQVLFGVFTVNGLQFLLWTGCLALLVEIEIRREPRLWLAFGAVAGLGLMNKHTIVVLALALAVGLLLTRARRHLTSRWLWLGAGVAALIVLPNLLWQVQHDWPSLEFYRNAATEKNLPTPPLGVLFGQILFHNPATLPLWGMGLAFFLVARPGRRFRHLGWLYLAALAVLIASQQGRPDRLSGVYPLLFAGGAVFLERVVAGRWRWLRVAVPALLVVGGLALLPIAVPVLPPGPTAQMVAAIGIIPQAERGPGKVSELPQALADRFGWEEMVADVARVADRLSPEERGKAVIFAPSYGHAGALELWRERYDLPPVYSTHNNYIFWGPPPEPLEVAIVLGASEEGLREAYDEVELGLVHDCDWCMRWRDEMPVTIVRGPRFDVQERWWELRHFE